MMNKDVATLKNLEHDKIIQEAIKVAIKAPSANNIRPWQVKIDGNTLEVFCKESYELDGGIFLSHLLEVLKENNISYSWEKVKEISHNKWIKCSIIHFNS